MTPFAFSRVASADEAVRLGALPGAKYLGGGTNLVDLMRETLERPTSVVDVTGLSSDIGETDDGGLSLGQAVAGRRYASNQ